MVAAPLPPGRLQALLDGGVVQPWHGSSFRWTFFSALIDRTVTPDELRHEPLSLIHGWPATVHQAATASWVDSWGAASVELEAHW